MHGLQCGFCTPGMIMRAYRLLQENPNPSEDEIRYGHLGQPLPLHRLPEHRQGDPLGRGAAPGSRAPWRLRNERRDRQPLRQREASLKGVGCRRTPDGGRPLHPRQGQLRRRPQAAGHAVRRLRPQPLRPRPDQAHRRQQGARPCPGVRAVLTAGELKPLNLHWMPTLAGDVQAVLADEKVLFQNQEVAFVVADDRYVAADAVELVEVEYEQLPALVDPVQGDGRRTRPCCARTSPTRPTARHGPRTHHNHVFTWEVGDKERTDAAFAARPGHGQGADLLPARPPCPARDLRLRRLDGQGEGRADGLGHVPGAACRPHRGLAALRHPGAQDPHHRARHRRRLRQQGRRLSGLYLLDRRLDRARRAGQVGRGPRWRTSPPPPSPATTT